MADDLALLMTLRVQGVASPDRVANATGAGRDAAEGRLNALSEKGLAKERSGRLSGFSLTPEGAQLLDKLLADEGLRGDPELTESYERFLPINDRVLKVCSDWQLRREGGIETPNDHTDPSYDASVLDRLVELHDRARVCLDKITARAPRFAPYRARLDECVERLEAADHGAFTKPLAESYHTVWFELHQDLLLTLGLQRES